MDYLLLVGPIVCFRLERPEFSRKAPDRAGPLRRALVAVFDLLLRISSAEYFPGKDEHGLSRGGVLRAFWPLCGLPLSVTTGKLLSS